MHTVWKMDMSHVTFLWVFSNFHLSVFKLDFQKAWKKQLQWKTQKLFFLTSEIQVAERHWRFLYSQTFFLIWPEELGPIGLFKKKTCRFKAHILNFSDQEAMSIFYVLCMGLTDIPTLPPGGQRESMIWQMLLWASWLAEASSADTPKNDSWWKKRVKLTTSIYIYKAHRHYKQKLLSVILLFISCCKKQINVSTLPTFLVRQELLKIQNLICWHPKHQNIWILDLTSLGQKTQSAQNFTRQQWNI